MTKELIVIEKQIINEEEINSVDARELWIFLGSKRKFADWITKKIKDYNFKENQDFVSFHKNVKRTKGSSVRKEYMISLDMAKELSMVERTEKGKEARQYFIECERIAKGKTQNQISIKPSTVLEEELKLCSLLKVPEHLAQIESVKQVKQKTGEDISRLLLIAPAQNNIKDEEIMLEPSELGKHFNLSGMKMNQKLNKLGLQINDGYGWKPTKRGKKVCTKHSWKRGNKSGYNLKWNLLKIKNMFN